MSRRQSSGGAHLSPSFFLRSIDGISSPGTAASRESELHSIHTCISSLKCVLQAMQPVEVPIYNFETHQRDEATRHVPPADVVIVEGILVLHMPQVQELLNMRIFVDTDDDVRLARRSALPEAPRLGTHVCLLS